MILVLLFDLKFLKEMAQAVQELRIGGAGKRKWRWQSLTVLVERQ